MKILGIAGNLRVGDVNTALLEAARVIPLNQVVLRVANGRGELPHFNPDVENPDLEPAMPASVTAWRDHNG